MYCKKKRRCGFTLSEVIVALTVMAMVMVGLAMSLYALGRFNRYQLVRQRCTAAAQAQLESITATGEAIPAGDFERLWPGLTVSVEESAATGQWEGLTLVEVTATGRSFQRQVTVGLCRYILAKGE